MCASVCEYKNRRIHTYSIHIHDYTGVQKLVKRAVVFLLGRNKGLNFIRHVFPLLPQLGPLTSDIMLLNFGLHSNNVTEYQEWLEAFRDYYSAMASQLPFVVWRETSPQHFARHTGEATCPDCEPLPDFSECVVRTLLVGPVSLSKHAEARKSSFPPPLSLPSPLSLSCPLSLFSLHPPPSLKALSLLLPRGSLFLPLLSIN